MASWWPLDDLGHIARDLGELSRTDTFCRIFPLFSTRFAFLVCYP